MRRALLALLLLSSACHDPDNSVKKPTRAELLKQRPYGLHVPPHPRAASPLVVLLHGQCGDPDSLAASLNLLEAADAQGFFVALPYGTSNQSFCPFWNASGDGLWPWDEDYLAAVVDDVKAKQAIDPNRVYFMGYSLGAFMAYRMACVLSDEVAGVVPMAGLVSLAPGMCETTKPVSVLHLHGDKDFVISYDGGPLIGDPPRQSSPSAHDSVNLFARKAGCKTDVQLTSTTLDLVPSIAGAETIVEAASGCPPGVGEELWTLRGADHNPDLAPDIGARLLSWLDAHARQ